MLSTRYSGRDHDPLRNIDPLETTAPEADDGHWEAPHATEPLHATVRVPGSKSLTNRELVLAALADGSSILHAPLHSQDTDHMVSALRALGANITEASSPRKTASLLSFGLSPAGAASSTGTARRTSGSPEVNNLSLTASTVVSSPAASSATASAVSARTDFGADLSVTPGELSGSTTIDCGAAGTVMRFVPPIAALALGPTTFDADASARGRPMGTMIEALRSLGADVADNRRGVLPFTVHGTGSLRGGEVTIDASASSQFVSGLLLAAPGFEEGLMLHHAGGRLPSIPHIEMTIACLAAHGVQVSSPESGTWVVEPQPITAHDVTIEPDLSNAAPFLAAALVAGGEVTVAGWPDRTTQVGDELPAILETLGATVSRQEGRLTVTGSGEIHGVELDLSRGGELAPVVVALAALASSPSVITGIGHLRGHETDRLAALANNINGLGGAVTVLDDGLRIEPAALNGGEWRSYDDHRMATAAAVIGLKVPGIVVDDVRVTAKTLPQFVELWHGMLQQ